MTDSVLNLPDDTRMLDVVRRGLDQADSACIAVSFTRCSGLGLLIEPLHELADRGGNVRLLTSTYQAVTQPEALETLLSFPKVETRVQSGPSAFHAKFWWFKGAQLTECWAGSSNLTKGGLSTNLEWNLRSVDSVRMSQTLGQFEQLWSRGDVEQLSAAMIERYRKEYLDSIRKPAPVSAATARSPVPNAAQTEALAKLAEQRAQGVRRAAIIAATGIGKTLLAAFDVRQAKASKVLYVSHRLEHLVQSRRAFESVLGRGRRYGVVGGDHNEVDADVIFVTVASLNRRPELLSREWDYLVIDEFHHVEAKSYEVLRPIRERAFLLGITATPERQDGHDVLEWCDWNIAYEVRLPEAIQRRWLLPFHYFGIADESVPFEDINWRKLDKYELEDMLSVRKRAELVLKNALEHGFDGVKRATVGFCAGRKHGQFMADTFVELGQVAAFVSGEDGVEDREKVYARLSDPNDPLKWLFVSDILNEGVDLPAINSVLFLRPTESATLFLQQLGRGLRLFPGTEVLTVLDFVGHHQSAWLSFQALDAPGAGGRRTEVADGVYIRPPADCEVVLQRRTREILAKIERYTSKKELCADAYRHVRAELGRPVLPIDLWGRTDVPDPREVRNAFGSWISCQTHCGDRPGWSLDLPKDHSALEFLQRVEMDWQMQRLAPYALVWGLCQNTNAPESGYEEFFARWPQFRVERASLEDSRTWATVEKRLGSSLVSFNDSGLLTARDVLPRLSSAGETARARLDPLISLTLGSALLREVEGRLLYTIQSDYQTRHGGVLRSPADLRLYGRYTRPEIIRHFGKQYDPATHNTGIIWFGDDAVIIVKLDTSTAKAEHQYSNRLTSPTTLIWTSQNQMTPTNPSGEKVLDHQARGRRLHIFLKADSHDLAIYLGLATVRTHTGSGPMSVTLDLAPIPQDCYRELVNEASDKTTMSLLAS